MEIAEKTDAVGSESLAPVLVGEPGPEGSEMTARVSQYLALRHKELELRALVIKTQNPAYEDERVKVALEREELLFELTLAELGEVQDVR